MKFVEILIEFIQNDSASNNENRVISFVMLQNIAAANSTVVRIRMGLERLGLLEYLLSTVRKKGGFLNESLSILLSLSVINENKIRYKDAKFDLTNLLISITEPHEARDKAVSIMHNLSISLNPEESSEAGSEMIDSLVAVLQGEQTGLSDQLKVKALATLATLSQNGANHVKLAADELSFVAILMNIIKEFQMENVGKAFLLLLGIWHLISKIRLN